MHGFVVILTKSFALHLNFCPMRACLTARQAAFTFFLFACPYYFVMLARKKSKQKRPVQKKVTEWYSSAALE
jgi:hypothetical protein